MTELDHKFRQQGLGKPPYRLIAIWSGPSRSVAEQNPFAYNKAMAEKPRQCTFQCDHCGTGILHHFIIRSSDGKTFCVGSKCVDKLGDAKLTTAATMETNRLRREAAAKARQLKRKKLRTEREAELQQQRDRNGGLTDWEKSEEKKAQQKALFLSEVAEAVAPLVAPLSANGGDFCTSMATELNAGRDISNNCRRIITEILAKQSGRKGSKAYKAALPGASATVESVFENLEKLKKEYLQ